MIAYTTGDLGARTNKGDGKAATLRQLVTDMGVILADIRLLPWSQAPCWRKPALQALLSDRYVHIPELGNETRRTGLITIRDMERGLDRVQSLVQSTSRPPLLLCCCWTAEDCHREDVAEALCERPGFEEWQEIGHWGPLRR